MIVGPQLKYLIIKTILIANDLRRVAFLVHFKVDSECNAAPIGGGGGGELGGVVIYL